MRFVRGALVVAAVVAWLVVGVGRVFGGAVPDFPDASSVVLPEVMHRTGKTYAAGRPMPSGTGLFVAFDRPDDPRDPTTTVLADLEARGWHDAGASFGPRRSDGSTIVEVRRPDAGHPPDAVARLEVYAVSGTATEERSADGLWPLIAVAGALTVVAGGSFAIRRRPR